MARHAPELVAGMDRNTHSVPVVCIRVVGIQLQRALELRLRSRPIALVVEHQTKRCMRFSRLRMYFGSDELTFQMTTTNALAPQKTRTFTGFSQAEREVINARVYVGIHYRNSDTTAKAQGRSVANWVFEHYMRRVDDQ
jgi:hypothetical protein